MNGVQLSCPYAKGTAAYALYAVLHGTDWSVGTVDVDGTFDLETDKKNYTKRANGTWDESTTRYRIKRRIIIKSLKTATEQILGFRDL